MLKRVFAFAVFQMMAALGSPELTCRSGGSLWAESENEVTPHWSKATLCDGPLCVSARWAEKRVGAEFRVGDETIRVIDGSVELLDAARKVVWQHKAGAAFALRVMAVFEGVVFLSEKNADPTVKHTDRATLRRLRMTDGTPLEELKIPTDGDADGEIREIVDAMADEDGLFVLSETSAKVDEEGWRRRRYRISCFRKDWTWSRSFAVGGELPAPGAFLWGSYGPARDQAAIRSLTKMGQALLVCAGPLEDLIALKPESGETVWQVPRLWEYRKGFVGPSVWSYLVGRYGMNDWEIEQGSMSTEEIREQNAKKDGRFTDEEFHAAIRRQLQRKKKETEARSCSILAGPVVVPLSRSQEERDRGKEGPAGYSIFVITAQGLENEWPEYLSECVVYELNEEGNCLGIATLPRLVVGRQFHIVGESIFWRCSESDRVRLFPSSGHNATGSGNSDRTIDFDWHSSRRAKRQSEERRSKYWLRQASYYGDVVFRGEKMLSVVGGGGLETQESQVLRYPLRVTDLETGEERNLELRLPFEGRVSPPKTNYSRIGDDTWFALSGFLMILYEIEMRGDELRATFKYNDEYHTVSFPIDKQFQLVK